MTLEESTKALRRLSDSLQAALEDPAQLAALSQMLHYEQGQLRSDAGELSGIVEALENGSLYEFDEIDLDEFEEIDWNEFSEIDYSEYELDGDLIE